MHRFTAWFLLCSFVLFSHVPTVRGYTLQFTDSSASIQVRWPSTTIPIALSSSLNSPPPNIRAGSDVVGAAQRALARWSEATGIQFSVTFASPAQTVAEDGISLITVSQQNAALFSGTSSTQPGRARIIFNPANGAITESDVAINPNSGVQFSTDGTSGTYDLEATFTHEIGHLLGLEHSGIVGATMQPRQSRNGFYDFPAFTMRTLSDDDRAGVRSIYGARSSSGTLTGTATLRGTVNYPGGTPAFGAHVWLEDAVTGRAVGGNVALVDGRYRIDGLAPGRYRVIVEQLDEPVLAAEVAARNGAYAGLRQASQPPFRTLEVGEITLLANEDRSNFNIAVGNQPFINPTSFGANNFLSSVPVPLAPGTYSVLVGGDNLFQSQVTSTGISVTSPFITVDQSSVFYQVVPSGGGTLPVIGFNVTVNSNIPSGEYSIRLQTTSGEVAYVTGCLAVENASGSGIQFSQLRFAISEGGGRATLTVTRGGDTTSAASVEYTTSDAAGVVRCDVVNGTASARCDYATTIDTLRFAAGETEKTISVPITDDAFVEGTESFTVTLSNAVGAMLGSQSTATVEIVDNDTSQSAANPIDNANFFVRQQYLDFLSREPEPEGFAAWLAVLARCNGGFTGSDPSCDRIEVSASFFRSEEFQLKGYFVYRFYRATLGRRPLYAEIIPDMRRVTGIDAADLIAKRDAFAQGWLNRAEFRARYDGTTNAEFVRRLFETAEIGQATNSQGQTFTPAQLVAQLDTAQQTRANIVRLVVESREVESRFYNEGFVTMQYVGYLRRDPEEPGFTNWLRVIESNPADYRLMVNGFLNSVEYRLRFGQP